MKKSWLIALLILASMRLPALAEDGDTPNRSISTTGEAVVYVAPDEAIVTLGVQTADAKLDVARAENQRLAASLLKTIKSIGVEDKHIATGNLQVDIRYRDHGRGEIDVYQIQRIYMVTLKDVSKLESLVEQSLQGGANILQGVEFKSSQLRKHRDQARSMAIRAAREKAVALAKELECTVGAPQSISESGGVWWPQVRGFNRMQNSMQDSGGGEGTGESIPLGQIGINATVSVVFDLNPPEQG